MSEEKKVEDRGDVIDSASDESGETDDQKLEDKKDTKSDDADKQDADDKGGDDNGSDESDDDAADKKDDKAAEKKEEPRIPKSRFDQAVAKARKGEAEAVKRAEELQDQLDAQKGAADTDKIEEQIDKLEDDLEGAIKDGNADKKMRLRKEIRKLNQEIAETKAAQHAARATAVAIERITYDGLVKTLEAEHPELNPDDESYDQDVVDELNEYKSAFEAAGHGSTEALRKSLRAIYGKAPAKPKADEKKDEADEAEDKGKEDEANKKAATDAEAKRKEDAVKRGLDTKKQQPADGKKAGIDSDKAGKKSKVVDVSKMSNKEFDKLDEEELKRARGDVL